MRNLLKNSFIITFLVKFSGLLRDALLFYQIGVSTEFDMYLTILVIPSIFLAIIVPFINLSTTPKLKGISKESKSSFMVLFFYFSMLVTFLSCISSLIFAWFTYGLSVFTISLVLICSFVIVFSVLAEFSCSVLIAEERLYPIYYGNLFINFPIIIYFFFGGNSVVGFALISTISYLFRFMYLNYFIYRFDYRFLFNKISTMKEAYSVFKLMSSKDYKSMLIGPSFQILIHLGRAACVLLPSGSASLYYYGFKLFDAFKGTIWFVVITRFFSGIQSTSVQESLKIFNKISVAALLLSIVFSLSLSGLYFLLDYLSLYYNIPKSVFDILYYSMFSSGLMFLVPVIDLYQRIIVTFKIESYSLSILFSMVLSQIGSLSALLFLDLLSLEYVIFSVSFALVLPALIIFNNIKNLSKA